MNLRDIANEIFEYDIMRDYIAEQPKTLAKWRIKEMIQKAPITLSRKREMLRALAAQEDIEAELREEKDDDEREWITSHSFAAGASEADGFFAGLELKPGELFLSTPFMQYYDNGWESEEMTTCPYLSFEQILDDIKRIYGDNEDGCGWCAVEKWSPIDGKLEEVCTYYLIGQDIYWVTGPDIHGWMFDVDVNLPVPFKPGDIIETDGIPFSDRQRALILEIGDNCDCCCVQTMHFNPEGNLDAGALKHGRLFRENVFTISPLYRAHIFEGELSERERIFAELGKFIDGSEQRGRMVWDIFYKDEEGHDLRARYSGIPVERLREKLKELAGEGWDK